MPDQKATDSPEVRRRLARAYALILALADDEAGNEAEQKREGEPTAEQPTDDKPSEE